ncbi:hypothetical protein D3C87_1238190 [compost metagenome]
MTIADRYATAIRSSCLTVEERTTFSDTDVLGSMACADRALTRGIDFAGRSIPPAPLAVALERLFLGDNRQARVIVDVLEQMAWKRARTIRVKLPIGEARDMAQKCLAWHRDNKCKPCGGHGVLVMPGTKTLGGQKCGVCKGEGTILFEKQFAFERRELARWLVAEMEREQAKAGPEAMKWIAPKLDL